MINKDNNEDKLYAGAAEILARRCGQWTYMNKFGLNDLATQLCIPTRQRHLLTKSLLTESKIYWDNNRDGQISVADWVEGVESGNLEINPSKDITLVEKERRDYARACAHLNNPSRYGKYTFKAGRYQEMAENTITIEQKDGTFQLALGDEILSVAKTQKQAERQRYYLNKVDKSQVGMPDLIPVSRTKIWKTGREKTKKKEVEK